MERAVPSEKLITIYKATWCHIPEDTLIFQLHDDIWDYRITYTYFLSNHSMHGCCIITKYSSPIC
jgi:hypothetical protein